MKSRTYFLCSLVSFFFTGTSFLANGLFEQGSRIETGVFFLISLVCLAASHILGQLEAIKEALTKITSTKEKNDVAEEEPIII